MARKRSTVVERGAGDTAADTGTTKQQRGKPQATRVEDDPVDVDSSKQQPGKRQVTRAENAAANTASNTKQSGKRRATRSEDAVTDTVINNKQRDKEQVVRAEDAAANTGANKKQRGKRQATRTDDAEKAERPSAAEDAEATTATAADARNGGPAYFLIKSEPADYSMYDMEQAPGAIAHWDGVRNPLARNLLRSMRLGDLALFYHSNCKEPAGVAIVKVVKEAYPDHTAFDPSSKYYDPKSTPENPKWWMVDFQLVRATRYPLTLHQLKQHSQGGLSGMALFRQSRLSVQPVSPVHWQFLLELEQQPPPEEPKKQGRSRKSA